MLAQEAELETLDRVSSELQPRSVVPLPVPEDCTDGFFGAYWKRPHAYLDPAVRSAISAFSRLEVGIVVAAMRRLESDLESGRWSARYASLLDQSELDLGYRLVIADSRPRSSLIG